MSSATGYVLRKSVRMMSTADVPVLSGTLTIDGIDSAPGDIVLLKDQIVASQRGFYQARADAWIRDTTAAGLGYGTHVYAESGTQAGQVWHITTVDPIVWGTTSVSFARVDGGGGPPTDVLVKVSAADATAQYLDDKIVAITPLSKSVVGGGTLQEQLSVSDFAASGAGHARGTVPDPGGVLGATKYLREDATWQVPPVGGGGTFGTGQITFAGQRAVVTIADAGVGATSHCQAFLMAEAAAPPGFTAEEHNFLKPYVGLTCGNIVAGVSFDVVGISQLTLNGALNIHWQRG